MTQKILYSFPSFYRVPDHRAISGRFFLIMEPFKRQGGRAVAMAAPEERRMLAASWRMTSASSPFTQAQSKSANRCLHPPPLEDHSHAAKPAPTKGLIAFWQRFRTRALQSCQTRPHPAIHNPLSQPCTRLSLLLCPLHPLIPAYTAAWCTRRGDKSSANSRHTRDKLRPSCRGLGQKTPDFCFQVHFYMWVWRCVQIKT